MNHDSTEGRIVRVLLKCSPLTFSGLAKELKLRDSELDNALKKLSVSGVIEVDPLPDEKFVRLLRRDIRFFGIRGQQKEEIKKRFGKKEHIPGYEGPMYA
ncbi:MAG: hypothetical protein MSIBF_06880 [Candidatus Altiarchaeales archaeon IMC4]|nr:MAG: hypothetical protein MSIBF_06880 [Candidatus Altiarchaeales archaeon IMC4]